MRLLIIISVVLLAGCQSTSGHHAKCADYGFIKGTTEYGQCMMTLEDREQRTKAAMAGYYQNNPSAPPPLLDSRPAPNYPSAKCTSYAVGDRIVTSCN